MQQTKELIQLTYFRGKHGGRVDGAGGPYHQAQVTRLQLAVGRRQHRLLQALAKPYHMGPGTQQSIMPNHTTWGLSEGNQSCQTKLNVTSYRTINHAKPNHMGPDTQQSIISIIAIKMQSLLIGRIANISTKEIGNQINVNN